MRRRLLACEPVEVLTCVIVDDNPSFLGAATALLEREGIVVAGVASTSAEALRQVAELQPDVVVVDVILGEENGFDLALQLAGTNGAARVVLTSTHAEDDLAELIAESPAIGFVPKSELSGAEIVRLVSASRET
jgi:DNA-binding NarL/FixJ family response regulator